MSPFAPRHYCAWPQCHELVSDPSSGYCPLHRHSVSREYNRTRTDRAEHDFYQSKAWKAVREAYLLDHPYCEEHLTRHEFVPAVLVHHIKAVKQYPELALTVSNLRAVCESCHSSQHGPERGGVHE
jgi:5-methylcytosine-specific restriction endonuclease McrA